MSSVTINLAPFLATVKTKRAAVIPYVMIEGSLRFLLGVDNATKDITDIGGGVKRHEVSLSGAERELEEEAIGIFDNVLSNPVTMYKSIAVYDEKSNLSSIFMPVDKDLIYTIEHTFDERKSLSTKKIHHEMDRLLWVDEEEMHDLIYQTRNSQKSVGVMWTKLRNFYSKVFDENFVRLLRRMC